MIDKLLLACTWANLVQAVIVVGTGVTAYLVASNKDAVRKWGFRVGICCQPFWLWSAWHGGQWGIAGTCFWYAFCYHRGLRLLKNGPNTNKPELGTS